MSETPSLPGDPSSLPATSLPPPMPLEALTPADILSGKDGVNRSRAGHRQISADTDRDAVLAWLARYADSPNTMANSRRETERLLLWSLLGVASENGK